MLRIIPICALVLLTSLTSCSKLEEKAPCLPNRLRDNVVAFYTFSNGSLNDLSVNNIDLTNPTTASATTDREGNSNCAYLFSNSPTSTEYLIASNTSSLDDLNKFSVSLWYQPLDTARSGGEFETLISRGSAGSCPNRRGQWSVALYDCRKAVFGRTNSVWDTDLSNLDCDQEVVYRTGEWTHLVATYEKKTEEMKIYRNGLLQDTSEGRAICSSGLPSYQDIGDLFLGQDYSGKLDDVILFNKSLSQAEVNLVYRMETCCD